MINDPKDIAEILKVLDKITFKQLNEAIKNANIEFVGETMLSDEEKKKYEEIKYNNGYLYCDKEDVDCLIDIIEKQSIEIEELKETLKCTQNSWYEDAKIIDKIKAKIEELEKQDKESRFSKNYLVIHVLQSLLEEE